MAEGRTYSHPLPECERAFGRIEESQKYAKELRLEHTQRINDLHKEVVKLTGNGNKGRIDDLAEQTAVNTALLTKIDSRFDKIEGRQWSLAIKVAGFAGSLAFLGAAIAGKF